MNIINMNIRRLDETLLDRYRKISPSELGHDLEFGFLDNDITLLDKKKQTYIVGSAVTVRIPATDSTMVYKAMTYSKPGDILCVEMHGEKHHACWGEMTTLTAKRFGLAGAVIDGPNTDSAEIMELDFPVFSRGQSNLTTKISGFRGDINVPVSVGGVVVCPGDLILANNDGILVIPHDFASRLIEVGELYEQYNISDRQGFADGLPLTEIMSFEKKIATMDNIVYIGEENGKS